MNNGRHTYPVLLDADWGSEGVLKDEEALSLDSTFYGNVGRFINHRCALVFKLITMASNKDLAYVHYLCFFCLNTSLHRCYDANLVEIPVEVEPPVHHYYHVSSLKQLYSLCF